MRPRDHPGEREIIGRKVVVARKYLGKGLGLKLAAQNCAIQADVLDRYLFRTLGMPDSEVAWGRWLNIPA